MHAVASPCCVRNGTCRAAARVILAFSLFSHIPASLRAQELEPQLEQVLEVLEVRDASLRTLKLPFTMQLLHGETGEPWYDFEGSWCRKGTREIVRISKWSELCRGVVKDHGRHTALWDGGVGTHLTECSSPQIPSSLEIRSTQPAVYFAWLPQRFGLQYFASQPWSNFLRPLARTVQFDSSERTDDGRTIRRLVLRLGTEESNAPKTVLWIDTKDTHLVWKWGMYKRRDDDPQGEIEESQKRNRIFIDGRAHYPTMQFEIVKAERHGGYWVGTEGTFWMRFPGGNTQKGILKVGTGGIEINSDLPDSLFEVRHDDAKDLVVDNRITRTSELKLGAASDRTEEAALEKSLKEFASTCGAVMGGAPPLTERLAGLSCGPRSLYAYLRLKGYPIPIGVLTADGGRSGADSWSLADLEQACKARGVPVRVFKCEPGSIPIPQGPFLGRMTGGKAGTHGAESNHYAVIHVGTDAISMFSPPSLTLTLTEKEFLELWTGYALVVGSKSIEGFGVHKPARLRGPLLGIGMIAVIASLIVAIRKLHAAKTVAAVVVVAFAFNIMTGCSKRGNSTSANEQGKDISQVKKVVHANDLLVFTSPTRVETGEVDEGVPVKADFKFTNTASVPVELSTDKSCGVQGVLDPRRLEPGETGRLECTVNTLDRTGVFHEYVELKANSLRVSTLWIVGRVRTVMRLHVVPVMVDIKDVPVGTEITSEVSLTSVLTGNPTEWEPRYVESKPDQVASWKIQWEPEIRADHDGRSHTATVKGRISVRALRPGPLRLEIPLYAARKDGTAAARTRVKLVGDINSGFQVQPKAHYFSGSERASVPHSFELQITPVSSMLTGRPQLGDVPAWITSVKLEEGPAGTFRARLSGTPPLAQTTVGKLKVSWEGAESQWLGIVVQSQP